MPVSQIQNASLASGVPGRTNLPTGSILQTVSTSIQSVLSTTSASWANVTGLAATITPVSASSKIYIVLSIVGSAGDGGGFIKVQRNGTDVMVGTGATSNRINATMGAFYNYNDQNVPYSFASNFQDSPSSTSALTYQVLFRQGAASSSFFINRNVSNTDAGYTFYGQSSITLFEIAG